MIEKAMKDDKRSVFSLASALATSYVVDESVFGVTFDALLADPRAVLLVAKQSGNIVGYCLGSIHASFYANGEVAWLEELYVLPDHRMAGLGRALVIAFEEWCRQNRAILVTLATRRADAFYLAIGYESSATYFKKSL